MTLSPKKIAVVLLNMGGPEDQASVRAFLQNLFSDRAIIDLPYGVRHGLAGIIARRREKQAKSYYQLIGGGSPIAEETEKQRSALGKLLEFNFPERNWLCVTAMRYTQPDVKTALEQIREFGADQVICLPLYPQFSTTTSGSSLLQWKQVSENDQWQKSEVISYEQNPLFIKAHAKNIQETWEGANKPNCIRVLFSAHGLPRKIVAKGDPYPEQIQTSATLIAKQLPAGLQDWQICYQSRVGPLQWIGPSTSAAIQQAVTDQIENLLVVPIAFVSEHVETLVELDIEIYNLAKDLGIGGFLRTPALRDDPVFIACLADEVEKQL